MVYEFRIQKPLWGPTLNFEPHDVLFLNLVGGIYSGHRKLTDRYMKCKKEKRGGTINLSLDFDLNYILIVCEQYIIYLFSLLLSNLR